MTLIIKTLVIIASLLLSFSPCFAVDSDVSTPAEASALIKNKNNIGFMLKVTLKECESSQFTQLIPSDFEAYDGLVDVRSELCRQLKLVYQKNDSPVSVPYINEQIVLNKAKELYTPPKKEKNSPFLVDLNASSPEIPTLEFPPVVIKKTPSIFSTIKLPSDMLLKLLNSYQGTSASKEFSVEKSILASFLYYILQGLFIAGIYCVYSGFRPIVKLKSPFNVVMFYSVLNMVTIVFLNTTVALNYSSVLLVIYLSLLLVVSGISFSTIYTNWWYKQLFEGLK